MWFILTKKLGLLILICFLSMSLMACGKTEQKTPPRNESNLLEQIKKKGKVTVGTEATMIPFEYIQDGKIVGYGSDILAEIAKSLGVEVEQLDVPFSGILSGLEEKKFDFIATAIVVTPERKEKFGVTIPIADSTFVLMKRYQDDSIKTIEDLNGKIVGTQAGSAAEKKLQAYNEQFKKAGKEGIKEMKQYQSYPEAYLDLKNGRIDVIDQAKPIGDYMIKEEPNTYELVSISQEEPRYISWVVRKEDKELLEFINAEILKMKKSGKLAELQQKWFGTTWNLPDSL